MDGRMGKKREKEEKKEEQSQDPRATNKWHGKRMNEGKCVESKRQYLKLIAIMA